MLEQSEIAHYLLSLGLVKPSAVVDGDLTIVDASRRNCVFIASTREGPTYVVKQAAPRTAPTLEHEAAVLRAFADGTQLAGHVPVVVHHEPEAALLVLRSPAGARDWARENGGGRFSAGRAGALGRALAGVHAIPAEAIDPLPAGFDPLWGLSLPEPSHDFLLDLSAGAKDLVERLQANVAMCARLAGMRRELPKHEFVHGDLRWDNCLAVAAPGARRRTRVLLIDWELAGRGAAAFDVGTVVAEYLCAWLGSIPIVRPSDPGRLEPHARHPLSRIRPAIQAFWSGYRHVSPRPPAVRQVVEFAAIRLVHAAIERAAGLAAANAHVVTLVQLAENMLETPEEAALGLLGLDS